MIAENVRDNNTLQIREPRSSLSRALIITRRELKDGLRDWRSVGPVFTLTVIAPLIALLAVRVVGSNFASRFDPGTFENRILPLSVLAVGFLPMSFSLVIALETFVGEKERNSLEALMSAPLTDLELYMGKFIAAVIPPIVASTFGSLVFISGVMLTGGPLPAPWPTLLLFLGINICEALVMVAGAVIVSSHATSVRGANLLASFVIIPVSLVIQVQAVILLVGEQYVLIFVLLALLVVFLLLLRTGIKIFNREEIVAREADNLNIKKVFRNFGYYFSRTPQEIINRQKTNLSKFTVWRLYRRDIPQIIKSSSGAFFLIMLALLGAAVVGMWVSTWEPVRGLLDRPGSGINRQLLNGQNPICVEGSTVLNGVTWQRIFLNNVGATLLASGVALATLGVGGIGLIMLAIAPIGLIGGIFFYLGLNPLPLLFGFVLPHGIIELPVVVLAVAVALKAGTSFMSPPSNLTIGQNLQLSLVNYVKILALVVPLLLVAAIIEANITPTLGCWLTGGRY